MQNHEKSKKLIRGIIFFYVMVGVIALTFGFFTLIDFLPEAPRTSAEDTVIEEVGNQNARKSTNSEIASLPLASKYPVQIVFDSLDRKVTVLNPESSTITALDNALLSGVVRHPDSADFVNTGTIFLLGHSSYLPSVLNKSFQAFNGIQKLEWGDIIRLRSEEYEYVYSVDKVYEAKASDAEVPLQFESAKLVLATCNSFGTKDDRYIVEASLIATRAR